jgi:hypothetical protein
LIASVLVHVPIAVIVASNSATVILPIVFDLADVTVKVAVPHEGDSVNAVKAVVKFAAVMLPLPSMAKPVLL